MHHDWGFSDDMKEEVSSPNAEHKDGEDRIRVVLHPSEI